jgi:hypothetical protein
VLVGSPNGLYPLDGENGAYLFGTNGTNQFATINPGCRMFNTPAVADVPGVGPRAGWHVFDACGGPKAFAETGEVASYRLPIQPKADSDWPMFRGSPEHEGVAFSSIPGLHISVLGVPSLASSLTA